jgi:pimeloyl-ACP methyl ester carboxylesterase
VRSIIERFRPAPTALLAGLVLAAALPATAGAEIAFAPCGTSTSFACGHVTVPLDPSGTTPGTITLALRRHLAPVGNAKSAVVALAGGPGQAALAFSENFLEILGPVAATRDLIVFDQRGTGLSHPLSCHGFERQSAYGTVGALVKACAGQIGAERAFYTTPDTVADIEAIRRAGGYEKLVLYGTSYGTKVALEYAQEHPEHVEALVLDSTVTASGPEPLDRPTFAAIPRILHQLCEYRDCAGITADPVADLARLLARMQGGPVGGRYIDGHGHAHRVAISASELYSVLLAGDFDPLLRAEFVAAVRGAAAGDDAALTRLLVRAASGERDEAQEDTDLPLYFATTCEEQAFPWSRTASPAQRLAQARAYARSLPAGVFAPFTAADAVAFGDASACAYWPNATAAPPVVSGALPDVPTLILSGADDLRTPTSGARAVAAQIPDAHLIVVPNTGHSVLGTEPTSCAREALQAMFAGQTVKQCRPMPPPALYRPTPLPPQRLKDVPAAHGYRGRPGRTLTAVTLTLADFSRQLLLAALESGGASALLGAGKLDVGGLRAGWAQVSGSTVRLHGYTYVPGVRVSGTVGAGSVTLQIGGRAAADGTLRLGAHRQLVGVLGGEHVQLGGGAGTDGFADGAPAAATGTGAASGATGDAVQAAASRLPLGLGAYLAALPQFTAARSAGV